MRRAVRQKFVERHTVKTHNRLGDSVAEPLGDGFRAQRQHIMGVLWEGFDGDLLEQSSDQLDQGVCDATVAVDGAQLRKPRVRGKPKTRLDNNWHSASTKGLNLEELPHEGGLMKAAR
uniref:Uncharacterized protein n=1 Tax=Noctiluca scintillans TaxID=2966 RepID=A0A7S1FCM7_NOCSC